MKDKIDPQLAELETIRKLLVLALLRTGMSQAQMGAVLGIHQTQVGRMFPTGALAGLSGKAKKATAKSGNGHAEVLIDG